MRRYLDAPLIAFVLVMVAAASITSHGTWVFYSYILPSELATAATVVLTAGIPLLILASVLDPVNRPRYLVGELVLLTMEALAQYYQGQAIFVAMVARQFPQATGIDLATFAKQPEGRILPILYLATLSAVVVYFGYAASARIRDLRARTAEARVDLAPELEQARTTLARQDMELARLRHDLARQPVEVREVVREVARPVPSVPTRHAILDYVRAEMKKEGASLKSVARDLEFPESTVRGWLATQDTVKTNGHPAGVEQ